MVPDPSRTTPAGPGTLPAATQGDLGAFFDSAPVGFALFDTEQRFVRVNAAMAAITGVSPGDHVGLRASELLGDVGEDIEQAVRTVLETRADRHGVELQGVLPALPNRQRQFLVSTYGVTPQGAGGAGVGATVVETTERLRVELALRGQRDLYDTLLRAQSEMGEAFVLLEGAQAIYVNEAAERMTGRTAQELYDLPSVLALFPPELHAELRQRTRAILAGRLGAKGFETELSTPAGERVPVEVSAQPLEAQGRPRLVVVARDVSERRRQDTERERLLGAERQARLETETAHQRARMLAELSEVMDRSMELRQTLPEAVQVLLHHGAGMSSVHVLARGGETLERMAIAADDLERDAHISPLLSTEYPLGTDNPMAVVARTRRPLVLTHVPDEVLSRVGTTPAERELLLRHGPRSLVVLPLVARGRSVGVVTVAWAEKGREVPGPELHHLNEVARRLATGVDNAQVYAERAHIASTLQAGLLPPELPAIPRIEAAARYLPAGEALEVGGDFYDLYATGEDRWAVVVGDVCGKGAEAAAVTAMARYTLRAATIGAPGSPATSLSLLNTAMTADRVPERFLTAVLGELRLSPEHADVVWACAGHPAPIVVRANGSVGAVAASGALLGVADGLRWDEATLRLHPGDAVVLYTDGVTEADRRSPMGPDDLAAALAMRLGGGTDSAAGLADSVRAIAEERAHGPLRDDVAIVALRLTE